MTTLIKLNTDTGQHFQCDGRCHNAKGKKCTCVCEGVNRGVGQKQAARNTIGNVHDLDKKHCEVDTQAIHDILSQQDLFPQEL